MGRRSGEVSPPWAAQVLELNAETVRRWCRGETDSRLRNIRRDVAGRYWLDRDEVLRLAGKK